MLKGEPAAAVRFMAKKKSKSEVTSTAVATRAPDSKTLKVAGARLPARPINYVPNVVAFLGKDAQKRFLTFFTDKYRNKNTRVAYHRNACQFFEWCEAKHLAFADVESFHVSAYLEQMIAAGRAKRSVKQSLATIRKLFDWLIVGQVCKYNPAQAVEGPKVSAKKGSTPYLDEASATAFLKSIDVSSIVGLRDRALIGLMTLTFARVEAAVAMNIDDYFQVGKKWKVNLHEKGGKQHSMPAHHKLEEYLDEYIQAAGGFDAFPEEPKQGRRKAQRPLFRTTRGRSGKLTNRRMHRVDAWRMIRRRAAAAGLRMKIGPHSFRATGITNYMSNGGDLKKAQEMANHASTKTTSVYDHSGDQVTLDEVERITIGS